MFPGVLPRQGLLAELSSVEPPGQGCLQAGVWQPAGKCDLLPLLNLPG